MSILFFYPLVWLGALAAAIPIWLHLRRRQEANVLRFSALRFLEDEPVPQRSPLRLRDLLLFALRVLALLLLVAAFAWPYYPHGTLMESHVYLLDNTLSHQANGDFGRARDQLLNEMARAGPETQIAVVELTAQPRAISGFDDNRSTALRKVRALAPSFQRGPYTAAFRQAEALLANALGPRKRLVVFSDNQENQWSEVPDSPAFLGNIEVELPKTAKPAAPNLALARPQAQRTFAGNKTVVDLAVELLHQGEARSALVTVKANGREILRRPVDLTNQPKHMLVTAQWETDPLVEVGGEVSVAGEPDALAGDNRVFFALPPIREGRLVLLARSPFLRAALSPDIMRGYWATRLLEPTQVFGELKSGEVADVLCIESSFLQFREVRDLVMLFLKSGHGVLLLVNGASPLTRAFLSELGFDLQTAMTVPAGVTAFRYVFTEHPIFRPFRSPDFGNLMEIKVFQYQRLKAPQAVPLIFSQSGDALFFHAATPKGQLFVCAFGLDRRETNWPLHPTFLPFLDLCLQNAREKNSVPTVFEPGEMCLLNVAGEKSAQQFVLRDGSREILRGPVKNGRIEFPAPDRPGLYTLAYDAVSSVTTLLAVNPSPLESELTYLASPESVRARLVASAPGETKPPIHPGIQLTRSEILRQQIWWLFLVAGLALLLSESLWLAVRRVRS
jgi:hypothetical protein